MVGDHKNSAAFWAALKVQPIIQSGVQTWKALILVPTVMIHTDRQGSQSNAGRT